MSPQRTIPATPSHTRPPSRPRNSNIRHRTPHPTCKQLTMQGFFPPTPAPLPPTTPITPPPTTTTPPLNPPPNTDTATDLTQTQLSVATQPAPPPPPDPLPPAQTILVNEKENQPWGDFWRLSSPTTSFHVFSKNTGTINPLNSDMLAITAELQTLGASVFAAQETNIHWDPASKNQIFQQCRQAASHVFLSTASSQEPSSDWYKPGGTLTLALSPCTSRIVKRGSDQVLGRWSYIEFAGKENTRLIVVSAYRVCNQKFDVASNTATAQQI